VLGRKQYWRDSSLGTDAVLERRHGKGRNNQAIASTGAPRQKEDVDKKRNGIDLE